MSDNKLPVYINPLRMAASKVQLEGKVDLLLLRRVCELVKDKHGEVAVLFEFGVDADKHGFVKGKIKANLTLECQRCLSPMPLQLELSILLSPVRTIDEANALPECYEPLMLPEDSLKLSDIIEEEILLNIPLIPKHPQESCSIDLKALTKERETSSTQQKPFEKLSVLKSAKKLN